MALDSIGPFTLHGVLGRGGMGTVYRAIHEESGEKFAVKVLAPVYSGNQHFRQRFEAEIKALIKLDHPNIVRLSSYGQEDGNLFFAMELINGPSLFHMQRQGHHFHSREILKIATDVANGLRHAHDRGIIHRDLKPGNLLKNQDGQIKITDFGIAKRFGYSQNTGDNVLGTMDFMSPEQARGQPVSVRSDLYSLGTVMFTLLSGRPPFTSNSVEESLRNLTKVPAPLISSLVPDIPIELEQLIAQLMAKNPDKRVQTAQALIQKIKVVEQVLLDQSQAQTAANPAPKKSDETFDNSSGGHQPRTQESGRPHMHADPNRTKSPGSSGETTVQNTKSEQSGEDTVAHRPDYFNPVTDQLRQRQTVGTDDDYPARSKGGIVPILLALTMVVLLGGLGFYYAYKNPSPEELYEVIEANLAQPARARTEIKQFLELYPDDGRASQIRELEGIADAIAFHNTLSVRKNIPGGNRLTPIEKRFLTIAELAETDSSTAFSQMSAFVTLHSGSKSLDLRDQQCLEAAEKYKSKIKNDAAHQRDWARSQIQSALSRAEAQSLDRTASASIYEAIVELYADVEWADDLVQIAKARLKDQSAKKESP